MIDFKVSKRQYYRLTFLKHAPISVASKFKVSLCLLSYLLLDAGKASNDRT